MIKKILCITAFICTPITATAGADIKENLITKENTVKELTIKKKDHNINNGKEEISHKKIFDAKKGEKLSSVIKRWSNSEDWTLYWGTKDDYILPVDINISGNLENSLELISESLTKSNIEMKIDMFKTNKAVVVK